MEIRVEKKTLEYIREVDPDFYLLWTYMTELGMNPTIIIPIIRAIASISMGTRYGKVQVYIDNGVMSMVDGVESTRVNQKVLLDKK